MLWRLRAHYIYNVYNIMAANCRVVAHAALCVCRGCRITFAAFKVAATPFIWVKGTFSAYKCSAACAVSIVVVVVTCHLVAGRSLFVTLKGPGGWAGREAYGANAPNFFWIFYFLNLKPQSSKSQILHFVITRFLNFSWIFGGVISRKIAYYFIVKFWQFYITSVLKFGWGSK